ncbi:MAG: dihydrofolate reductase [Acidobacteriota bacterium]
MTLSLIVAMSANGVIGRNGGLPWKLSTDLKRFKQRTMGHHLVMGRKTFEAIGRPLPGRTTVVISRQQGYAPEGVLIARSLEEALAMTGQDTEVFVAGGGQIYALALERANRMYLTRVHAEIDGDTYFPKYDESQWKLVEREDHPADAANEYPFSFLTFTKMPRT